VPWALAEGGDENMTHTSPQQDINEAISVYTSRLTDIETRAGQLEEAELFHEIDSATANVLEACARYEPAAPADEIGASRAAFQQRTERWAS
jgi:hypothetical protein